MQRINSEPTIETPTKQKQPASYRFVLMMAILASLVNVLISISINFGRNILLTWFIFFITRFLTFNAPLLWLLSH